MAQGILGLGAIAVLAVVVSGVRTAAQLARLQNLGAVSSGAGQALVWVIPAIVVLHIGLRVAARRRLGAATWLPRLQLLAAIAWIGWILFGLPAAWLILAWLGGDGDGLSRALAILEVVDSVFLSIQVLSFFALLALAVGNPFRGIRPRPVA